MRHVNTPNRLNIPYRPKYTFGSPKPTSVYVTVLKFIDSHPGCKRSDIQKGVWGDSRPGLNSTLFSQMLYADLIDYNSKFEYVVRRKGKSILRQVAWN